MRMARSRIERKTKESKVEVEQVVELKCTRCGETKRANSINFYKSYSEIYKSTHENRMTICKTCLLEISENFKNKFNSETRSLYEICKLLDVYYEKALYLSAKAQAENKGSNPYQIYFQKVLSMPQYRPKIFLDSEPFDVESDLSERVEEVGRDIVEFWGDGYSQNDYDYLNREFETMLARYEVDSYAQEMLMQEICFQRLEIKKKRASGSSVDKEIKTLQDLLGSANIKPAQENASMSSEQVTFGTLIKKFENEKPIPEPLPDWMDADWIRKYVNTWFFGNLMKMMGKPNPYADEYKKEMDLYTVKPLDEDGE